MDDDGATSSRATAGSARCCRTTRGGAMREATTAGETPPFDVDAMIGGSATVLFATSGSEDCEAALEDAAEACEEDTLILAES